MTNPFFACDAPYRDRRGAHSAGRNVVWRCVDDEASWALAGPQYEFSGASTAMSNSASNAGSIAVCREELS